MLPTEHMSTLENDVMWVEHLHEATPPAGGLSARGVHIGCLWDTGVVLLIDMRHLLNVLHVLLAVLIACGRLGRVRVALGHGREACWGSAVGPCDLHGENLAHLNSCLLCVQLSTGSAGPCEVTGTIEDSMDECLFEMRSRTSHSGKGR